MQSFINTWLVIINDEQITTQQQAKLAAKQAAESATEKDNNIDFDALSLNDALAFRYGQRKLKFDADIYYGSIPETNPYFRYGQRPSDPNWGQVFPQWIDNLVRYFGMTETAEKYIQNGALPLYLTNLANRVPENGGLANFSGVLTGDWVPPYPAPKTNMSYTAGIQLSSFAAL